MHLILKIWSEWNARGVLSFPNHLDPPIPIGWPRFVPLSFAKILYIPKLLILTLYSIVRGPFCSWLVFLCLLLFLLLILANPDTVYSIVRGWFCPWLVFLCIFLFLPLILAFSSHFLILLPQTYLFIRTILVVFESQFSRIIASYRGIISPSLSPSLYIFASFSHNLSDIYLIMTWWSFQVSPISSNSSQI